jgi:hypothetical protein
LVVVPEKNVAEPLTDDETPILFVVRPLPGKFDPNLKNTHDALEGKSVAFTVTERNAVTPLSL